MSNAEQLLELLASVQLEAHLDDPEKLGEAMAKRQALLMELQNADTVALDELSRARLESRLRGLLASDERFQVELANRMEDKRNALQKLRPGHAALRGYANTAMPAGEPSRRFG